VIYSLIEDLDILIQGGAAEEPELALWSAQGATSPTPKPEPGATKEKLDAEKEFSDLDWLSSLSPDAEEELFSK
jgi:hypothetical protein